MSKKRKSYSSEFKTKVVLGLLKEEDTAAIASRYGVTVQTLNQWKRKFLENASLAFDIGEATKEYREKIEKLEKENEALAKTLGRITIERLSLQFVLWGCRHFVPRMGSGKVKLTLKILRFLGDSGASLDSSSSKDSL